MKSSEAFSNSPARPADSAALLEEAAWLRSLARRLLKDPDQAEDAVQDTLTAAVEHPPKPGQRRGWLGTVLRNFVHQRHRARARLRAREEHAARRNEVPSTADVLQRLTVQRQVVDAVQALDEPYRTAIVLRFLDGLPPREVARRTKTPVKTVHTRIHRGLARLRVTLDAEYGGRRDAWAAILFPVAAPKLSLLAGSVTAARLGLLLMSTKTLVLLSTATVCLVGLAAYRYGTGEPARHEDTNVVAAAPAPDPVTPSAAEDAELPASFENRRVQHAGVDPEPATPAALPDEPETPATFRGRVVDPQGLGVGGLNVQFVRTGSIAGQEEGPAPEAVSSDADGSFEMTVPTSMGLLRADGNGYATVVSPGVRPEIEPGGPVVIVAPGHSYAGFVTDGEGTFLAGAHVAVELGHQAGFDLSGRSFLPAVAETESDENGAFRFDAIGHVDGTHLLVSLDGHESVDLALPPLGDDAIEIVLPRIPVGVGTVAGRVIDGQGRPVEGAWVSVSPTTTRTDASGEFVLEPNTGLTQAVVRAAHKGFLPTEKELELDGEGRVITSGPVVLVLEGEPLTIRGTVVDTDGSTVEGAQVWTFQGEELGMVSQRFGELDFYIDVDIETILAGGLAVGRGGRDETTDEGGAFELYGLLDRPYTLFAMHPKTMEVLRIEEVSAGARNVRFSFEGTEVMRPVSGHVLTVSGEPVEGARVRLARDVVFDRFPRNREGSSELYSETDADGRFQFAQVCIERTKLVLTSGERVPNSQTIGLSEDANLGNIVFRVHPTYHLRVTAEGHTEDAFFVQLLDPEGTPVMLTIMAGSTSLGADSAMLNGGRSDRLQVTEPVETLILLDASNQEVTRLPLDLKPGELNEIRL